MQYFYPELVDLSALGDGPLAPNMRAPDGSGGEDPRKTASADVGRRNADGGQGLAESFSSVYKAEPLSPTGNPGPPAGPLPSLLHLDAAAAGRGRDEEGGEIFDILPEGNHLSFSHRRSGHSGRPDRRFDVWPAAAPQGP